MSRRRLALIDGHALAYRAFFALREQGFRNSRGEPTYAVFAFAQILLTMIQEQQPSHVAVAFDIGRTFRDDLYSEYKAGRAETPEDFYPQFERIRRLVDALAIPVYTAEGFEADDVIGTLARQAAGAGIETLILTGDTDALQLVDEHVNVLLANPYGGKATTKRYHPADVSERYDGLRPDQLADLRGLKGDSSDNIPGVKGIGEKGAIALLKQFGSVEAIFDHLTDVPNRYKKVLDGQREAALFSKRLATIVTDVPVMLDLTATAVGGYDRSAVVALFQELEIGANSNLLKKLPPGGRNGSVPAPAAGGQQELFAEPLPGTIGGSSDALPAAAGRHGQLDMFADADVAAAASGDNPVTVVSDEAGLRACAAALRTAGAFAFDTESSGLSPFSDELVGISLACNPDLTYYVPVGHREGPQVPFSSVRSLLGPLFADAALPKYAHNAKFDIEMLLTVEMPVNGLAFDTMIAAALLGKRQSLKDLAFYELKLPEPPQAIEALIGRGAKQLSFADVPLAAAAAYAGADARHTLQLTQALLPQIEAHERLHELLRRVELPLVAVLTAMEAAGIMLDGDYLTALGGRFSTRIAELTERIFRQADGPFNINSGAQLNDVLFGRLGIDPRAHNLSKLKTGGYSITAEVLEELALLYPIAADIQAYRQLSKLKSTYIDALPQLISPRSGRIHTSYNQVGAATGRLSSNNPNLQNIPVRTEEGREIRRAFVAADGYQFVAADYSQIELRVLAHYTRDAQLVEAFTQNQDIHAATAAKLFNVPAERVDKNQRRIAKTVVFGVIYGISAFGLAQRLGLDRSTARSLIDELFAQFPGIRQYIDSTLAFGREHGYVSTLFGRRRQMEDLQVSGPRRAAAEREAINAPIQGTAADIMKIAMVNVYHALQLQGLRSRLLLQVHDELIVEAPHDEVDQVARLLHDVMSSAYPLAVPLGVEVEAGPNWDDLTARTFTTDITDDPGASRR
jgi:DNA polymerase I